MENKLSKLKRAMASQDWEQALRIASKFPRLGEHKEAITRGWAVMKNPSMYEQMGQNVKELEAKAIAALRLRYS